MPKPQRVYILVEQVTGPSGMRVFFSTHSSVEAAEQMALPEADIYFVYDTFMDSPDPAKLSKSRRGRAKQS